ncbi:MAG: non-ribosomal peptide synthetase, partial [Streptomyces sp.]|nr:non-ribosomal peptide synthetase [Streptomyces sp.]
AVFVALEALPLTSNGKVDRTALPHPDATGSRTATRYEPPRNAIEEMLADIWTDLLAVEQIGIHDDLFALGADSLLALRAVAGAAKAGLHLELQHVFTHPTIAQQATVIGTVGTVAEQGSVSGPTGLTGTQKWFLEQDLPERHHWNDASFLLSLQRPLDLGHLQTVVNALLAHHDALRLRFHPEGEDWHAEIAGPDGPGNPLELPLSVHDFSHLRSAEQKVAVTQASETLQRSLDLGEGPLLRVAYFNLGDRPHCLLVLAHWLAVDHYSARTLLEDLLNGYSQLEQGRETPELPAKTTSFQQWTALLAEHADSEEVLSELDYWTDDARRQADDLLVDHTETANSLESLESITLRLDHRTTEALLRAVPAHLGVETLDVQCAALLRALPVAHGRSRRSLLVDLERHGRDMRLPGAQASRTVGRFSTIAPLLLSADLEESLAATLKDVRSQLGQVPAAAAGYGLLRYLSSDPRADVLRDMPGAQVGLNYVGQVDEVFLRSDLLSVPRMSFGQQRSRVGTRVRALDVLGYVVGRRLTFTISYSSNLHEAETVDAFVKRFRTELEEIAALASDDRPKVD